MAKVITITPADNQGTQAPLTSSIHFCTLRDKLARNERLKLLSLYGGGIRGLMQLVWLKDLERQTGRNIAQLFDIIIGTSIGGIMGGGIAGRVPRNQPNQNSVDHLLEIFAEQRERIFPPQTVRRELRDYFPGWVAVDYVRNFIRNLVRNSYNPQGLEDILLAEFGEINNGPRAMTISQTQIPLFITAVKLTSDGDYDLKIFDSIKAEIDQDENYLMQDILRATSAAPTFFPPKRIGNDLYIDGGVGCNNPAFEGYKLICKYLPQAKGQVDVFSLSTGNYLNRMAHRHGLGQIGWALPLLNALFTIQAKTANDSLDLFLGADQFFNIDANLGEDIPLNATAMDQLQALVGYAEASFALSPYQRMLNKFISNRNTHLNAHAGSNINLTTFDNKVYIFYLNQAQVTNRDGVFYIRPGHNNLFPRLFKAISHGGMGWHKAKTWHENVENPNNYRIQGIPRATEFQERLYLAYTNHQGHIIIASSNDGNRWSRFLDLTQVNPNYTASKLDIITVNNQLVLIYLNGNGSINFITSVDGQAWSQNQVNIPLPNIGQPNSNKINAFVGSDKILLAYLDNNNLLKIARHDLNIDRNNWQIVNVPQLHIQDTGFALFIRPNGKIFIAYLLNNTNNIMIIKTTDFLSWENVKSINLHRQTLSFGFFVKNYRLFLVYISPADNYNYLERRNAGGQNYILIENLNHHE